MAHATGVCLSNGVSHMVLQLTAAKQKIEL